MSHWARQRDKNEATIVAALRAHGASVSRLDGAGIPDLLVGLAGETELLEVKLPLGPKGGRQTRGGTHMGGDGVLTEAQVRWWAEWRGMPATIVRTTEEALGILGDMRTRSATRKRLPRTMRHRGQIAIAAL